MKIEKGKNLEGNDIWFVLDGADLITTFNTEEEAKSYITNGI